MTDPNPLDLSDVTQDEAASEQREGTTSDGLDLDPNDDAFSDDPEVVGAATEPSDDVPTDDDSAR